MSLLAMIIRKHERGVPKSLHRSLSQGCELTLAYLKPPRAVYLLKEWKTSKRLGKNAMSEAIKW